jgi:hypothetical protein
MIYEYIRIVSTLLMHISSEKQSKTELNVPLESEQVEATKQP